MRSRSAVKDFQANMLPQTRWQVFWDVLKNQPVKLLACGALVLAFAVPWIVLSIFSELYALSVYEQSQLGTLSEQQAYSAIQTMGGITSVARLLCILVLFLGLAGVGRILRQLAWEENLYVFPSFLKGIRQNSRHFLLIGAMVGIVAAGMDWLMTSAQQADSIGGYLLELLPTWLCVSLLLPAALNTLVCVCIYSVPLIASLRYGLVAYGKRPFWYLPFSFLLSLLLVSLRVPVLLWQILGSCFVCLIAPVALLGWFLLTLEVLDKTIHPLYYPQLMKRGLYIPENPQENAE